MNNHQEIDLIYPIIKGGSKSNDLELLYSLRSVEKNLTGYRNIIIVGHLPEFINHESVIHIPFKDGPNKQLNIRNKILAAFEVSEQLLFMNDDHFLLTHFEAANFPYFFSGTLPQASEKAARISGLYLSEVGNPIKQFDIHCPIVYKKELFKEAMRHYGEDGSIKSLYANHWHIEGVEYPDLKINSNLRYERILQEISGRHFFSVGDYGINQPMKRVLSELFPNASKYELQPINKAA